MITLYGMGSPNVVKVYIALEEVAPPYEVHAVDVFSGKQFDDTFLKLNPNAKGASHCRSGRAGRQAIHLL